LAEPLFHVRVKPRIGHVIGKDKSCNSDFVNEKSMFLDLADDFKWLYNSEISFMIITFNNDNTVKIVNGLRLTNSSIPCKDNSIRKISLLIEAKFKPNAMDDAIASRLKLNSIISFYNKGI
jgi:hypothetical protein